MTTACKKSRLVFRLDWMAGAVFSLAVLSFAAVAANAATLTNRDKKDHKVTIIEGETKTDQVLKPEQVLEKICLAGCILRLNDSDDDEYQIEIADVVSIEDGYLYHDNDVTEPAPQGAAPSPAPGAPAAAPPATAPAPSNVPTAPAVPPAVVPGTPPVPAAPKQ